MASNHDDRKSTQDRVVGPLPNALNNLWTDPPSKNPWDVGFGVLSCHLFRGRRNGKDHGGLFGVSIVWGFRSLRGYQIYHKASTVHVYLNRLDGGFN